LQRLRASDHLADEHSAVNPISLYAQTKVDSEKVLLEARTASFHPVVLRLATVFGAGYRPRFDLWVNLLVAEAYHHRLVTIYTADSGVRLSCRRRRGWHPANPEGSLGLVSGEIFNLGDPA